MSETIGMIVLKGGEHIIGIFLEQNDGVLTVEKPVNLVPGRQPGQMMFIPYLQFTNSTVCEFKEDDIRHTFDDVKEDLLNAYKQQFITGLQVPQQNLILS